MWMRNDTSGTNPLRPSKPTSTLYNNLFSTRASVLSTCDVGRVVLVHPVEQLGREVGQDDGRTCDHSQLMEADGQHSQSSNKRGKESGGDSPARKKESIVSIAISFKP